MTMKIQTEFDLSKLEWGKATHVERMGIRIQTDHGVIELAEAHDGSLRIRAVEGFLVVAPIATNTIDVRPRRPRGSSPFGPE